MTIKLSDSAERAKGNSITRQAMVAALSVLSLAAAADAATVYTYSRSANNTSGTADPWAAGTNWDAVPSGGADRTLVLTGTLAASGTAFTNNNISGTFDLNKIDFSYAGPSSGTAPVVTLSGNALRFVNDDAIAPVLQVNATGTVRPLLAITAPVTFTTGLTKTGNATVRLTNTANSFTGTTTVSGGTLQVGNGGIGTGDITVSAGAGFSFFTTTNTSFSNTVNLSGSLGSDSGQFQGANQFTGTVNVQAAGATIRTGSSSNNALRLSGTLNLGAFATNISSGGSAQPVELTGTLQGSGGLTLTNGNLLLNSNSSGYSGVTTLSRGTLLVGNAASLGSGTLALAPANDGNTQIRSNDANPRSISNALTLSSGNGNSFTILGQASTGNLTFTGGSTLTGVRRLQVRSRVQFDGNIGGAGSLTMLASAADNTANGVLVLNGNNTYNGNTLVNHGTLVVGNVGLTSATGTGNVTVTDATLAGTGRISGNATLALDSADADTTGATLRPSSATDPLAIGGLLTLAADSILNLSDIGALDAQTAYTLITYGTLSGTFAPANVVGLPTSHEVSFATPGQINLVPVPEPTMIAAIGVMAGAAVLRRRRRV